MDGLDGWMDGWVCLSDREGHSHAVAGTARLSACLPVVPTPVFSIQHTTARSPPRFPKPPSTHVSTHPPIQPAHSYSVVPDEKGRKKFKVVYVVLESQYQSTLTAACTRINEKQENVRARGDVAALCGSGLWPSAGLVWFV